MPKITQDVVEQSSNKMEEALTKVLLMSAQTPTVVCGVARKVNIGHFENVDIYCGVSLPLLDVNVHDMDELKKAMTQVANDGFAMASKETGERYIAIKEAIKGGRDKVEETPAKEAEESF